MRIVLRLVACHAMRALVWPSVMALRLLLHPRFGAGLSFGGCGAQLAAEALLAGRLWRRRRTASTSVGRRVADLEEEVMGLGDALVAAFAYAGRDYPPPAPSRHLRLVRLRETGPQRSA